MRRLLSRKSGFSLVEGVISVALAGLLLYGFAGASGAIAVLSTSAQLEQEALGLLAEGEGAVRFLATTNWNLIAIPVSGANYGLSWNGSAWTIPSTPTEVLPGFTRSLQFMPVSRNGAGSIALTGTDDPATRAYTVTVSWNEKGKPKSFSLNGYVLKL